MRTLVIIVWIVLSALVARADYIVLDQFTSNASAPLATPRTATPGPGMWNLIDTENKLFTLTDQMWFSSRATSTWGDPGMLLSSPVSRQPGRGLFFTVTATNTGRFRIGFSTLQNAFVDNTSETEMVSGKIDSMFPISTSTAYDMAFVERGTRGGFVLIRGGAFTSWTLLEVSENILWGTLYPGFTDFSLGGNISNVYCADLTSPWNGDMTWGLASVHVASPGNPEIQTGTADGIVSGVWNPTNGEVYELSARRTDDANRIIIRCCQSTNTIKVVRVQSGSETELASHVTTAPFVTGTEFLISAYLSGSTIIPMVNGVYQSETVTETFNQSATGIESAGSATNRDLAMWPLHPTVTIGATTYGSQNKIFGYGDSKTTSQADTAPWNYGYALVLDQIANVVEIPTRIGHPGYTVSNLQSVVDADLAASAGTPDFVIFNAGVNDLGSPIPSNWDSNYAYILDAFHAKWPGAKVLCTDPWDSAQSMTVWNTMATHITNILSTRTAWASIGLDERITLAGSDNGASLTRDGVHPNHAGAIAEANAWAAAIASFATITTPNSIIFQSLKAAKSSFY